MVPWDRFMTVKIHFKHAYYFEGEPLISYHNLRNSTEMNDCMWMKSNCSAKYLQPDLSTKIPTDSNHFLSPSPVCCQQSAGYTTRYGSFDIHGPSIDELCQGWKGCFHRSSEMFVFSSCVICIMASIIWIVKWPTRYMLFYMDSYRRHYKWLN